MKKIVKTQANSSKGEHRTKAILLDGFRVFKDDIDLVGDDWIICPLRSSKSEIKEKFKSGEQLGAVQAKYIQDNKTTFYIDKDHVLDGKANPANYFLFVHTDDDYGEHVVYFMTAPEIIDSLPLKKNGYFFNLGKDDQYSKFKNIKIRNILNKINTVMSTCERSSYISLEVARAVEKIKEEEFYRVEGELPNYIKLESKVREIGGLAWEGLGLWNEVLTAAGWDVKQHFYEDPEHALEVLDLINRSLVKINRISITSKKKQLISLVSSQ